MAGVSRTTVSNVINGNTKRVSQKTIDKITAILKEQNYVPHMGSVMLSGHGSRIIGVVLGFAQAHGMYSLQDSFVGELVGTIQMEAEMKGYYIMLIGGENIQNVVDIASRWNVEGLIILGYNDEKYRKLSRKLNKKMVLIDAYPAGEYFFQNVGVDDYSGGYQIGSYLCSCGFDKALFLAETDIDSDYSRWMGFKQAMEKEGKFCSRTRLIVIPGERNRRIQKYKELLPRFLQVKAVAFSSDYAAIEAMNFLSDHGIKVPEQVSVTGFDDSIYARMVRPRLTTVHQDVGQKAHLAFSRLLRMVAGEQLKEFNIKYPVTFKKDKRVVSLNGEAFFKVAKSAVPFVVSTFDIDVQVLGTSFNVSAYGNDDCVMTTLVSGSVLVSSNHAEKQLRMEPGNVLSYTKSTACMNMEKCDPDIYTSWINGEFKFRDMRLEDIMKKVNRWYNCQIRFEDPSVKELRFSGAAERDRPVEYLLELIQKVTEVNFEIENKTIVLMHK